MLLLLLGLAPAAAAQGSRLIPTDDPAYTWIAALQRRGLLLSLNPTQLPYTYADVARALAEAEGLHALERDWTARLRARFAPADTLGAEAVGIAVRPDVQAAASTRPDPLRPDDDAPHLYPALGLQGWGLWGPFVAEGGLTHAWFYDRDPDGLDAARRLYIRSENGYIGARAHRVSAYLGRFHHHWAPPGAPGLVLSDNARSFDNLYLRFGERRLTLSGLLGELDNADPDGGFTGATFRNGSKRRYVAAHRLDWRPTPRFTLSISEAVLYAGGGSEPSIRFLNPVQAFLFEGDNLPKNDDNNIMIGFQAWGLIGRTRLHAQLLLDDVVVESNYPMRIAFAGAAGHARGRADLGVAFELVGSQTYNTPEPEARYLYLKRGLGTQFVDYVRADAFAEYVLPGRRSALTARPYATVLYQGERTPLMPLIKPGQGEATWVLYGDAVRTVRGAVLVRLQPSAYWSFEADAGLNHCGGALGEGCAQTLRFTGLARLRMHLAAGRNLP